MERHPDDQMFLIAFMQSGARRSTPVPGATPRAAELHYSTRAYYARVDVPGRSKPTFANDETHRAVGLDLSAFPFTTADENR